MAEEVKDDGGAAGGGTDGASPLQNTDPIYQLFTEADTNNDDKLDRSEVQALCKSMGLAEDGVDFDHFDLNNDQFIQFSEFQAMYAELTAQQQQAALTRQATEREDAEARHDCRGHLSIESTACTAMAWILIPAHCFAVP